MTIHNSGEGKSAQTAEEALDAARGEPGTFECPVPEVRPFGVPLTSSDVQNVWTAFVVPIQEADRPLSSEERSLMAVLRAVFLGLSVAEKRMVDAVMAVGAVEAAEGEDVAVAAIRSEFAELQAAWTEALADHTRLAPVEVRVLLLEGMVEYLIEQVADLGGLVDSHHDARIDRSTAREYCIIDYQMGGFARALEELTGQKWGDHARGVE